MNEQDRLHELISYKILDTPPEKDLDELAEIACLMCDMPVSLITLVEKDRQWFKTNIGLDSLSAAHRSSFCQHAIQHPGKVLVVNDARKDERFKKNPMVTGYPNIRFYAGAPLRSAKGYVLGTLCVIDKKPREISEGQTKALFLLAEKVMTYLNARKILIEQKKTIESNAKKLKQITDEAPGVIFQLSVTIKGVVKVDFISKGIEKVHPSLVPEKLQNNSASIFKVIHQEDISRIKQRIQASSRNLSEWIAEFRVIQSDGKVAWFMGKAKPVLENDGTVVWFGSLQNVTNRIEYTKAMEQIAFDISHILRRPVSTLLGLASLIDKEDLDETKMKEYGGYVKVVAAELDVFTKRLNETYNNKRQLINGC